MEFGNEGTTSCLSARRRLRQCRFHVYGSAMKNIIHSLTKGFRNPRIIFIQNRIHHFHSLGLRERHQFFNEFFDAHRATLDHRTYFLKLAHPPAMAGTMLTSSPGFTGVSLSWRKRTSSPLT